MKVQIIPEVGDKYQLKTDKRNGFSFSNKGGGTGMSNWDFDPKYTGSTPVVKVKKVWYDDECGYRTICEPINDDLIAYLKKNASKMEVYASEFDLAVIKTSRKSKQMTKVSVIAELPKVDPKEILINILLNFQDSKEQGKIYREIRNKEIPRMAPS